MTFDGTARSYDLVADRYEREFGAELAGKPFDRDLLTRNFAALDGFVADVGSGPGQVATFVHGLGTATICVDLSPAMARLAVAGGHPAVAADLLALPLPDRSMVGVIALYSIIHVPRSATAAAVAELARVLAPGARVVIAAHEGEGETHVEEFLGVAAPFTATLFDLDELAGLVAAAGLEVEEAHRRLPYPQEHATNRLYVVGRAA